MTITKEERVHDIFENISDIYDDANNRISLGQQVAWKNKLIEKVLKNAKKNGKILDLCTGTGDIAIALAKEREDLDIVGLDFSNNMLDVARKKAEGLKNIKFQQGNAMELPFEDGSFDMVTISFGLRNTSDYFKVISEIKRVLKDDGYILCMDSFIPDNFLVKPFYTLYFKYITPLIGGGRKNKKDYQRLYDSTKRFLRKKQLIDMYKELGFSEISSKSFMFGACLLVDGKK
jgi:demethylmenaquinone methyltransferase/2-methoxy-6-polyprenyl-1,4-benzoquinol methylase